MILHFLFSPSLALSFHLLYILYVHQPFLIPVFHVIGSPSTPVSLSFPLLSPHLSLCSILISSPLSLCSLLLSPPLYQSSFTCSYLPALPSLFFPLKRDSVTRFFATGFFLESVSPKPLTITLGLFRIFSKFRGDIRSSRFATGVNDTGGKWQKLSSRKILIILFSHRRR